MVNGAIAPRPLLGNNLLLVPIHNVYAPIRIRSFVYSMFSCPLVKGEKYKLTFYINTAKRKFSYLDILLSEMEPANGKFSFDSLRPSFTIRPQDVVADMKNGWQFVELEFVSNNNAKFFMLGDMSGQLEHKVSDRMNALGTVFHFIDEIKMQTISPGIPCSSLEANVKKLYDQNSRHTEQVLVDAEGAKRKLPTFIMDTLNIPAAYFENNSSTLKEKFKQTIDSIASTFRLKNISKIDIHGHTDSVGTPEKNDLLSLARAVALKDHLLKKFPGFAEIIFVKGFGKDRPLVSNATAAGRTRNRRVEIILTLHTNMAD